MQIDMDTIETSNLNRQFLFRKHHVGQSKAKVAAEAVQVFRPNASIQVYQVCHLYAGCASDASYKVLLIQCWSCLSLPLPCACREM